MKNIIFIYILLFTAFSCKVSNNISTDLTGVYLASGEKYEYRLCLNKDNTFQLKIAALDSHSGCEGIWKVEGNKSLILLCNEPANINETLQSGYMTVREQKLIIKSKQKLIFNKLTLEKITADCN